MTWTLALALVAAWRLARLAAVDYLTEPWRVWAESKHPKLGYLASCPWCVSVWLSPLVVAPAVVWPQSRVVVIVLGVLAASGVAGLLTTVEDRLDR